MNIKKVQCEAEIEKADEEVGSSSKVGRATTYLMTLGETPCRRPEETPGSPNGGSLGMYVQSSPSVQYNKMHAWDSVSIQNIAESVMRSEFIIFKSNREHSMWSK